MKEKNILKLMNKGIIEKNFFLIKEVMKNAMLHQLLFEKVH
jgi:hypothetical protein